MDSQTTDIKHWKHYEAQLITDDVIMKNNGKVHDVRNLACQIKSCPRNLEMDNCCLAIPTSGPRAFYRSPDNQQQTVQSEKRQPE